MSWKQVTITKSGERMLSNMLNGSKLTFTRVVIGDTVINENILASQTAVFSPISAPALIAGKEETEKKNGTRLKIQIRNDGVEKSLHMRQVGLYAKTAHDDEVLFAILQDEVGEEIPSFAEFSQFLLEMYVDIAISRTNNIQVVVSSLVYATNEDLNRVSARVYEVETTLRETIKILSELHLSGISSNISVQNIVIPTEGWIQSNTQEYDGLSIDVPIEGVTEDIIPMVSIIPRSINLASSCGLSSCAMTGNGYIRFYSLSAPKEEISASATLLVVSGTGGGGSNQLPTATETRLGGVKIGDNVEVTDDGTISVDKQKLIEDISATNEEAQEVISKYFGNN